MSRSQFCLPVSMYRKLWIQLRPRHSTAHLFALAFPHRSTLCNCSSVQASKSTDLTRLICVPIPRCIPEQLRPIVNGRAVVWVRVQEYTGCRQKSPSSSLPIVDLLRQATISELSSEAYRYLISSTGSTYACSFYSPHSSCFLQASTGS